MKTDDNIEAYKNLKSSYRKNQPIAYYIQSKNVQNNSNVRSDLSPTNFSAHFFNAVEDLIVNFGNIEHGNFEENAINKSKNQPKL